MREKAHRTKTVNLRQEKAHMDGAPSQGGSGRGNPEASMSPEGPEEVTVSRAAWMGEN